MDWPPIDDYYALLGVETCADEQALRRAWRRAAVRWHPDRAGHAATATFQKLAAAYEVLSDPLKRSAYDWKRRVAQPASVKVSDSATPARQAAPGIMLERISGPLTSLIACGAASIEDDGLITLTLSASDAAQGGMATIAMHVDLRCPRCDGDERAALCPRCRGTRVVDELFSAWLAIPPGTAEGDVVAPSVDLPGMLEPVRFRIAISRPRK